MTIPALVPLGTFRVLPWLGPSFSTVKLLGRTFRAGCLCRLDGSAGRLWDGVGGDGDGSRLALLFHLLGHVPGDVNWVFPRGSGLNWRRRSRRGAGSGRGGCRSAISRRFRFAGWGSSGRRARLGWLPGWTPLLDWAGQNRGRRNGSSSAPRTALRGCWCGDRLRDLNRCGGCRFGTYGLGSHRSFPSRASASARPGRRAFSAIDFRGAIGNRGLRLHWRLLRGGSCHGCFACTGLRRSLNLCHGRAALDRLFARRRFFEQWVICRLCHKVSKRGMPGSVRR